MSGMKLVVLDRKAEPERPLAFYLAAEEWVAANVADECLFTWVVSSSVICGRNQNIAMEVDLDYCRRRGIRVYRRRSGGGCVYADTGNIMISYVTPMRGATVETVFARYSAMVAARLRAMGLDAEASGRNDILVGGRKISGGAFYLVGDKAIVHSTMLYDTDFDNMLRAITPARAKLAANGVTSVESRITTAQREGTSLTFNAFRDALVNGLTSGRIVLSDEQIAEIESLERRYYDPRWLRIDNHKPGSDAL